MNEKPKFSAQHIPNLKTRIYNARNFSMLEVEPSEVEKVIEKSKQQQQQTDWLQIYYALIAGNKEIASKSNLVDQTDILYELYEQRWKDNA